MRFSFILRPALKDSSSPSFSSDFKFLLIYTDNSIPYMAYALVIQGICIWLYTYYVYECMYLSEFIFISVCKCTERESTDISIRIYAYIYVYMHKHKQSDIYIYTHIYICIHIHVHRNMLPKKALILSVVFFEHKQRCPWSRAWVFGKRACAPYSNTHKCMDWSRAAVFGYKQKRSTDICAHVKGLMNPAWPIKLSE